ncbi:hypothetical protein [Actinophytocola sp.]|uniref:hypothetical protein n=1 Tax=Actinophytocola sp. TaxID=1872138 RepID=UPI002ED32612
MKAEITFSAHCSAMPTIALPGARQSRWIIVIVLVLLVLRYDEAAVIESFLR